MNPLIIINVNMGSKGHRIGRLIASCKNVLWYDHKANGSEPWERCNGILNSDIAQWHFDRRFSDNSTIPPVLEYARRSGYEEKPKELHEKVQATSWRAAGDNLIYVTSSNLDESREYMNGKHLVVLDNNYDRFMKTTWYFRVGKTKKLISELYTKEECKTLLDDTEANYRINLSLDDFVIDTIEDLYDIDNFVLMCDKFDLEFDEVAYNKVKEALG